MWWSGADPQSGRVFLISSSCALIRHRALRFGWARWRTVRIAPDPAAIDSQQRVAKP